MSMLCLLSSMRKASLLSVQLYNRKKNVCVCVFLCVPTAQRCIWRPEMNMRLPGGGVTGTCEFSNVDSRI